MRHASGATAPEFHINVLFEDADIVVIDKPAGLIVHEDGVAEGPTVSDWYLAHVKGGEMVGEPIVRPDGTTLRKPGIVHRLDQETSGVLALPKTQEAFLHIKTQFQERTVTKEYRAFVHGHVKESRGTIDRPIGRSSKDFRLRSAQRGARGQLRPALTKWERLCVGKMQSYLAVFPKTGRTHQIRTHLKAINHPIIGDRLYAPKHEMALGFDRLALHAYALTLTLPSGAPMTFVAPLPQEFVAAEALLRGEAVDA